MKKIASIISIVLAASFTSAYAEPTGKTLEQFLAAQEKKAAEKGVEFTDKVKNNKTKQFEKMDTNKDGILTSEESKAYAANKAKDSAK